MSDIPSELRFTKSHEWIRVMENDDVEIGITDHAQEMLGDLVYVELPEVGASYSAGDECAVVESVKAASDIYAPVSGEVVAVNESLGDAPQTVNEQPYVDGWLFRIHLADDTELKELLSTEEYQEVVETEN